MSVGSEFQNYSPELIARLSPEEQDELLWLLEAEEQSKIDKACAQWIVSHKAGPMFWLRNHTATENYHWKEQNLPPVAPFPYKPHPGFNEEHLRILDALKIPHDFTTSDPPDYLDVIMGFFLAQKFTLVPKSREMITTWSAVGFITWCCQFNEKMEWLGQSEQDEKAKGCIRYANILYRNQPEWMKKLHPLKRGDEGTAHSIEWASGSRFIAVPQGERQSASYHPYGYFNDESAHQVGWKQTWDVAGRACKKMIGVSSAAPSDFGLACEMQG